MYICKDCGKIFCAPFRECIPKTVFTSDCPSMYGFVTEKCPNCGSDNFVESSYCTVCGRECLPNNPYLCDECKEIGLDIKEYAYKVYKCDLDKLINILISIEGN